MTTHSPAVRPPGGRHRRLVVFVGAAGRVLVVGGALILVFVAYQLWGTGIYEARQQRKLQREFAQEVARPTSTTVPAPPLPTPTPATTVPAPIAAAGEAVGIIRIPRIGLERAVVHGVAVDDLRKGPGHYPGTPLPGEAGNAAIAGHRTTYGAPFNRLDELRPGDPVTVTTLRGDFVYRVTESRVVRPTAVEVLDPTVDNRLTLTTCNPKYSARQRLIVVAALDPVPSPPVAAAPVSPPASLEGAVRSLNGPSDEASHRTPALLWGAATALAGAAWWWALRRRRHWSRWLAGGVPFLAVLLNFYAHLDRVLPASF